MRQRQSWAYAIRIVIIQAIAHAKEFIASGAAEKVLGARGLVTWNRPGTILYAE